MFRVIIAGSRGFRDYKFLCEVCNKALKNQTDIQVVSGGAWGADKLGERFAKEFEHSLKQFLADWDKYGKAAGYIRNDEMARNADALIAFWDGKSVGTKHMIDLANKHGLKVKVYEYK